MCAIMSPLSNMIAFGGFQVRQVCKNCGVCMGRYFCGICKLFDDDVSMSIRCFCLL